MARKGQKVNSGKGSPWELARYSSIVHFPAAADNGLMLSDARVAHPVAVQPMRKHNGTQGPWALALLLTVLLFGCSVTTWSHVQNAPGYQAPKSIAVMILVETAGEGLDAALGEFQKSLVEELQSRGIAAILVDRPMAARTAELRIVQWNMGSRWLRYWMSAAGEGYMDVFVQVTSADGRPGFSGVARGHVNGGWFGGSCLNAASAAAAGIAKTIATGKAEEIQVQ
jgi:hypothetical protein